MSSNIDELEIMVNRLDEKIDWVIDQIRKGIAPNEKSNDDSEDFINIEIDFDEEIKESIEVQDENILKLKNALKEVDKEYPEYNLTCSYDNCIDETLYTIKSLMNKCHENKLHILNLTKKLSNVYDWVNNCPVK